LQGCSRSFGKDKFMINGIPDNEIVENFDEWAVTTKGLESLTRPSYYISGDRLVSSDLDPTCGYTWLDHIKAKKSFNINKFFPALVAALEFHMPEIATDEILKYTEIFKTMEGNK